MKCRDAIWIEERDVLAIHDQILAQHGGAAGVRDRSLLLSALARPHQPYAYSEDADVVCLAAIYVSGLVRNHPFVDGNKRAGFVAGILFLELNGFIFHASEEDATQAVSGIASGTLDEEQFTTWLRATSKPRRAKKEI